MHDRLRDHAPPNAAVERPPVTGPAAPETLATPDLVHDTSVGDMLVLVLAAAMRGGLGVGRLAQPSRTLTRAVESHGADRMDDPSQEALPATLLELDRRLTALVHASPLAVVVLDSGDTVAAWNPAAERLFGWSAAEVMNRSVNDFLDDGLASLERPSQGGDRLPVETRRRARTGELVEVACWTTPLAGANDRSQGVLLVLSDIAERKRLDAERTRLIREQTTRVDAEVLRHRLEFLAQASVQLSASPELEATLNTAAHVGVPELADWCILDVLDDGGGVESVVAAQIDASREDQLRGVWRRYPPSLTGASPTSQALRTGATVLGPNSTADQLVDGTPESQDLDLLRNLAPLSVMAVPLIARDRIIGAMTFVSVRTERQYDAADRALALALAGPCAHAIETARHYREAQAAVQARDTFLSVASHELGSPLARVKAYAEVLLMAQSRRQLNEKLLKRSLQSIDRATSRLTNITQDLFDVSRLRAGELPMRRVRLNFARLIRDVAKHFAEELDPRYQLSLEIPRGAFAVEFDPDRMEQVLDNLLSNAVKYSPGGGKVSISLRPEGNGVLLQVRDQGIGAPSEAGEVIFEPFGRAANAERDRLPGMGLGLYICRSIIERHEGRIWAESPGEQQGMTISVWLPLANAQRPDENPAGRRRS